MIEPFNLYKRCEKDGKAHRCAKHPQCDCDWYDRVHRDGRRVWVHLPETAHNKPLAYRLAQKKRQDAVEIKEGLKMPEKDPAPLLGVVIKRYLAASVDSTKGKLTSTLEHFRDHIGANTPIDAITSTDIDGWRAVLLKLPSKKTGGTWSKNSVQRRYNGVKGLFSHLANPKRPDRELTVNPCEALDDWAEAPAPRRLWTSDLHWLINELPDIYRLPLTVGEHCIARRTEILTLLTKQLSPKGVVVTTVGKVKMGTIAFARQKQDGAVTADPQLVPLWVVNALWGQVRTAFQRHVFGDPPPEPDAWSSLLTRQLRALGEKHEIDTRGLSMHGTRHATATVVQATPGGGAETTRQMGGWKDLRQVQTYSDPGAGGKAVGALALHKAWRPKRIGGQR